MLSVYLMFEYSFCILSDECFNLLQKMNQLFFKRYFEKKIIGLTLELKIKSKKRVISFGFIGKLGESLTIFDFRTASL